MNSFRDTDGYRSWRYARIGDYHRNLDPHWPYTPTYLRKMEFVRSVIESSPAKGKILDVGCGEGVLVEEYRHKGWDIEGLDLNYESEFVRRGDVRGLPYLDATFDIVLFLDTLEHLPFIDQPKSLTEIGRVLKPGGYVVISVPNLAHFNSRIRCLLCGKLHRTDGAIDHPGERPFAENEQLLRNAGFIIEKCVGVTLTVPWLYNRLIFKNPARFRWLHDIWEPAAKRLVSLAMLTIFVCHRGNRGD